MNYVQSDFASDTETLAQWRGRRPARVGVVGRLRRYMRRLGRALANQTHLYL